MAQGQHSPENQSLVPSINCNSISTLLNSTGTCTHTHKTTHTHNLNFLIFKNRRITKVGRRYGREWGEREKKL